MTTLRSHAILDHDADEVWALVRDAAGISAWFPAMASSSGDQTRRLVTLADGSRLDEVIVTLDDAMRRLQYRAVGGDLPITAHLGTVDVLALDANRSLLVYSTEVEPDELGAAFHSAIDEAVQGLGAYLDGRGAA